MKRFKFIKKIKFKFFIVFFLFIILIGDKYSTSKNIFLQNSKPINYLTSVLINLKKDTLSKITINLVGDLMCYSPQINNCKLINGGYDFNPNFEFIKSYLEDADFTIGNLETTFAGNARAYSGYPAFNSPDEYCEAIKNAGFDFLVTANNHSMDSGEEGLMRTIEVIKKNKLGYVGSFIDQNDHDSIRIINIKGIKIAILNYTYGTNGAYPIESHKYMLNIVDSTVIHNTIKIAKDKGANFVLVYFHMGLENISEPTQAQIDNVNFALNAGANIVIGAHPHVIGPTKKVFSKSINDSAFIAYSLGNFLSHQYWRYTDAGVILKLTINKNLIKNTIVLDKANYLPTFVYRGDGQKKMHVIFPAELALYKDKLPNYINQNHRKKMLEAFEDTKQIITKYNQSICITNLK